MGVKIEYSYKFNGSDADVKKLLDGIYSSFKNHPGVENVIYETCDALQCPDCVPIHAAGADAGYNLVILFKDDGCEPLFVSLFKDKANPTSWTGRNHTKTQFARWETHVLACELLDELKKAGIVESVFDQAGYFEARDAGAAKKILSNELLELEKIDAFFKKQGYTGRVGIKAGDLGKEIFTGKKAR